MLPAILGLVTDARWIARTRFTPVAEYIGSSLSTGTGGVDSWTDRLGVCNAVQASSGVRPDLSSADSDFNAQDVVSFVAANNDNLAIGNARSLWRDKAAVGLMIALRVPDLSSDHFFFSWPSPTTGFTMSVTIRSTSGRIRVITKRYGRDGSVTTDSSTAVAVVAGVPTWVHVEPDYERGTLFIRVNDASETVPIGNGGAIWTSGTGPTEDAVAAGDPVIGRVAASKWTGKAAWMLLYTGRCPAPTALAYRLAAVALYALPLQSMEIVQTAVLPNKVWERDPGGGRTITGFRVRTIHGSDAATEARLVHSTTLSETLAWATVGTPTAGVLDFDLDVPDGSHFLQVRKVGESDYSVVQDTVRTNVGINVLGIGQSNMRNLWSNSGSPFPVTLPASGATLEGRRFSGYGYFDITATPNSSQNVPVGTGEPTSGSIPTNPGTGGNGSVILVTELTTALGYPVCLLALAPGGVDSASWVPGGSSYVAMQAALNVAGGPGYEFSLVICADGEADSNAGVSGATYTANKQATLAGLRTLTGNAGLVMLQNVLGPLNTGGATDASSNAIRDAQMALINDGSSGFKFAHSLLDADLADGSQHFSVADYSRAARRLVQNVLLALGEVATGARGPIFTGGTAAAGGNSVTLTPTHDGGTTLKDSSGSTSGTGITIFGTTLTVNGGSRTITSAALSGGNAVIGFDGAALSAGQDVTVRVFGGERPTITNVIRDDTTPTGDTVGAPVRPGTVTVTAA